MSEPQNFIIMLDALRHDYVQEELTPFLYAKKQCSKHAKVIETYSFQTRPAYFAGLEPDESHICHLFQYNPELSPFKSLLPFQSLLSILDQKGLDRFARGTIRRMAKQKFKRMGMPAAADVVSTEQIPLAFLPYFTLSERNYTDDPHIFPERDTIFDLFRKQEMCWNWIGYPRHYGSTNSILSAFKDAPLADVSYLHFSELDWLGHRHGPEANEVKDALRKLDSVLKELLTPSLEAGKHAIIFGDHGMVSVSYQLDLWTELQKLSIVPGQDYLFFLDSTQARFWYFNPRAKDVIHSALKGLDGGHFLTQEEKIDLHVNFKDSWYGEDIFAVDGPGIIHPSFFSRLGNGPKGMHGYMPHEQDNMTQVFAFGDSVSPSDMGVIPMIQIYDLLKETLIAG